MELVLRVGSFLYREMTRLTISFIRKFPSLEVNDQLKVEDITLSHKLLNTDNPDIIEAVKKGCVGDTVHCYPDHQTSSHPPALPSPGPCQGHVMLQHGHQADGEPCAHQMEGQVGEG